MTPVELVESYGVLLRKPARWAVDVRHVLLLHELLVASGARTYVEIGVGFGFSAIAAIEAIRHSKSLRKVYFCDLKFDTTIVDLCQRLYPVTIELREEDSLNVLESLDQVDFAFLDGDHSQEHVQAELKCLLRAEVKHIAVHDTGARQRAVAKGWAADKFNGPEWLLQHLRVRGDFVVMEDCVERPCEATGRGFGFATRDSNFAESINQIFKTWTSHLYVDEFYCRYDSACNTEYYSGPSSSLEDGSPDR
jgi:hypothetical protein